MKIGRNMIIAIMIIFCFTASLCMIIPIKSSISPYDPWLDYNDDGKISLQDLILLANSYGTTGTPINKTGLLLQLQTEINALNTTITDLQNKNTELENRVSILETLNGLPINWSNGLVGYWKLNEGAGTVAGDSSGNNNNGTLVNDPLWVNGIYGKALNFNGVNNFVSIPDSPSLRVKSFTLAAWIYMTLRPYQHGSRHSAIINKLYYQISGTGTDGYKLQFEDPTSTDDNLVVSIGDGTGQVFLVDYNSINDLTLNEWHQVVGTWNGSRASIYIDGQLKNSSSTGAYTILHDDAALALGTETTSGAKDVWFNGIIDEAMVFNRALSAEEVMAHYLLAPP